jgi:hypothetical protein
MKGRTLQILGALILLVGTVAFAGCEEDYYAANSYPYGYDSPVYVGRPYYYSAPTYAYGYGYRPWYGYRYNYYSHPRWHAWHEWNESPRHEMREWRRHPVREWFEHHG